MNKKQQYPRDPEFIITAGTATPVTESAEAVADKMAKLKRTVMRCISRKLDAELYSVKDGKLYHHLTVGVTVYHTPEAYDKQFQK